MATFFNLPLDILIQIFSRLPAKCVGKCSCVAKPWRTLLSTPQFIESHLTRRRDQENIIITTSSLSTYSIKDDAVSRKLEFPNEFAEVCGSCNGLVLLANDEYEYFLVNPVTLRQMKIPNNSLALDNYNMVPGFGYDRFSDDYKVVEFHLRYVDISLQKFNDSVDAFVYVYSVKMGIWKRVPYNLSLCFPIIDSGAFVNGAIHWLACRLEPDLPYVITAFNLVHEAFDEVPVPVDVELFMVHGVYVLGGCLCMYYSRGRSEIGFWVMKEYGVRESWTKFCIDVAGYTSQFEFVPLLFIGAEDVVLLSYGDGLVVYNLKERTLRDMFVDKVEDGTTFVESLVWPPEEACYN